ncbi:unnamed protein product [Polarella glacialis]|uniref:V-type proton ATPase subunit a n=2 Tax=Polarella glacialis TaxID=89957 RepID=A0A813FGQ3_POLGL|nr:unnamed protein product [Polarella glacialis]CAE8611649.1 unnamed protein product [Polarella glacialis]
MGLLRSETMKFGMLVLPVQDAKKYVEHIGKETNLQFEDMNSRDMRRPYRKHVQRIDEMERILRFMFEEIGRSGVEITKNRVNEFLEGESYKLESVEAELQGLYSNFVKFKENNATLSLQRNQAAEEAQVVSTAMTMLIGGTVSPTVDEESFEVSAKRPLVGADELAGRLGHLSGVVLKADEERLARALWRTGRGNTFVKFEPINEKLEDPKTGLPVEKSVFVIYFQGVGGSMQQKVLKVCQAFGANIYEWPASASAATARHSYLKKQLEEKTSALDAYKNFMLVEMDELLRPSPQNPVGNSMIEEWRLFCIKEKAIYSIMNLCSGEIALRVNVWYPASDEASIHALLNKVNSGSQQGAFLTPDKGFGNSTPPTYIRTNEYTEAFQDVIDTYGIPKYQEANPALLTVVTFPFIFGMMYGDVGHGSLLLLAGIWMCRNSESLRYTVPALFTGRYMVFSMGIFAIFAGFMYNDFFSVGLQLFDSRWEDKNGDGNFTPLYDVTNSGGRGPYPFGLDWAWVGSSNELLYVNSMKMKLSVLFGVLQMIVGVFLKWSNAFHSRNLTDFIFECLPMMTFMVCFFGWMDWMILYKWVHPIDNPPSIINSLICMAMGQQDFFPFWDGSVEIAQMLMKFTVLAVPLMLLPKPFILLYQHNQSLKKKGDHELLHDEEQAPAAHGGGHGHGEEFEFGEIFIHQIIETIEFVLGTVSHTASYLRIWALSLAHQQLSLVFFQKTLTMGLEMTFPSNGIMLYFMFAAWFGITCAVLLGMDVLECFLHTLRLHWVEFQSKFYKAGGEKFAPFNIRKLVTPTGDE